MLDLRPNCECCDKDLPPVCTGKDATLASPPRQRDESRVFLASKLESFLSLFFVLAFHFFFCFPGQKKK